MLQGQNCGWSVRILSTAHVRLPNRWARTTATSWATGAMGNWVAGDIEVCCVAGRHRVGAGDLVAAVAFVVLFFVVLFFVAVVTKKWTMN